jgi:deoxyhypusine synthase
MAHDKNCPGRPQADSEASLQNLSSIDPLKLEGAELVADLIDNVYAQSGFNARRLAEAARLYAHMIDEGATVCLTLAGAMTPIGMSGVINSLIRAGFIDCIISTGANLYHDMHRPFDLPMKQGEFAVDDDELADKGIARIYDVFIKDEETLLATDQIILAAMRKIRQQGPISTAQLHNALGRELKQNARHPEWSMLVTAADYDVPIYTSSPGDSSIAMNLAVPHLFDRPITLDPLRDVIETAAIVRSAKKNGVVVAGGGSPKNFYFQTQPTLHQIFYDTTPVGHDYVIQLTTDAPHWGGLSGATIAEAKSWGKIQDFRNSVIVYSCASLTLPLLAQYLLVRRKARPAKRLFASLPSITQQFVDAAKANPVFKEQLKRIGCDYDRLRD